MPDRWALYEDLVFGLQPTLDRMTANGVRVDTERQRALAHTLEDEIDRIVTEARTLAPIEVRPRKRYKRQPTEVTVGRDQLLEEIRVPAALKTCSRCQQRPITKTAHMKGECKHAQVVMTQGEALEWDLILPFNPLSTDQLMAYAKHHRHPLGRNIKTQRPSMDDDHLKKLDKRLGIRYPMYGLVMEARELSKAKSTYVDGFAPDPDGMIRGIFKNTPKTGRLAQANVALMQVPKRDEHRFAHAIRQTIVPRPGHLFVGADSSAMEGVLTGYFAEDAQLIALARQSVHAYLACRQLGWEFTPDNVKLVKVHHADLYARMKRTVFLSLYGGTARMMVLKAPDAFPTEKVAQAAQDFFLDQFPSVRRWWQQTREMAHKQCYLDNPWGWRNYFYNVYRHDAEGRTILGEDKNEVVAFLPQSSGGMFGRGNLKRLGASWALPYMPANGFAHDGYLLDVPKDRVEEAADLLQSVLTRPIPELGGLQIGCEIEVGDSWGDMEPYRVVTV